MAPLKRVSIILFLICDRRTQRWASGACHFTNAAGGGRASPAPRLRTPGPRVPTVPGHCPLENRRSSRFQGELGWLLLKTPDDQNIDSISKVSRKDSRVTVHISSTHLFKYTSFHCNTSTVARSQGYSPSYRTDRYSSACYYSSSTLVVPLKCMSRTETQRDQAMVSHH